MSKLETLRGMTQVVADTGDIDAIATHRPVDATTNPSLLLKAAQMEGYRRLVDDALDYNSSAAALGKNIGDDLAEGKPTLPLIHAMRESAPEQREVLREAVRNGGLADIDAVVSAIESTGSIAYTAHAARTEADKAIAALADIPDSSYKDALVSLAEFAVERDY